MAGSFYNPRDLQKSVQTGFDRLHNFRQARLLFLRQYVGQYYDQASGEIGTEPLNMIYSAVRALVPHIVMSFPKYKVNSKWLAYKDYGQNLGLALSTNDQEINIKETHRCACVDAIFTIGTYKTYLAQSDSIYALDETDGVDNGTIRTDLVSFDNLVVDPRSKKHHFRDAQWIGERLCVSRAVLLDSGLYDTELVKRLPRMGEQNEEKRADSLSRRAITNEDVYEAEDYVEIVELWVPSANALVTVPADGDVEFDDYLRVSDYYGPKEGPYAFLSLSPPVPDNPIPVPQVGIWHDIHVLANRMANKIINQADRQKDLVVYEKRAADDATEVRDGGDGDMIGVDDITAIKTVSFGGQQNSNEAHLQSLASWFSMMASSPEQLAGQSSNANSATQASILQNNASIGLDDAKDLVYTAAAEEGRKRAWYLHTDPLIHLPLTRRQMVDPVYTMGPTGPVMTQPRMMQEVQVILTPEMRRGDFLDFAFTIEPNSMGRMDDAKRYAQFTEFAVKIMPAAMQTAQSMMMMGLAFSPKAFIIKAAEFAGIDWLDEVFYDPEYQMHMQQLMMAGPQMGASKGQMGGGAGGPMGMIGFAGATPMQGPGMFNGGPGAMSPEALAQNGQPANLGASSPTLDEQANSQEQQGAAFGQSQVKKQWPVFA